MLASISPLGERARGSRWGLTVAAHVVGSTAGGLLMGAVLGALGWLLPLAGRPRVAVLAVLAGAGFVIDASPGLRLPTVHRQVDEDWLHRYRGWVYGIGYGFQLGLGTVTIVTTATTYVALGAAALTGSPIAGAAIGAIFGATRGLVVLVNRGAHDAMRLRQIHRRLQRWQRPVGRMALSAQAVAALVAAGTLVTGGRV